MSKPSNAFFSQYQSPRFHWFKVKHCHTKSSDISYSCEIFTVLSQSLKMDVSHSSITYNQWMDRWPWLTSYLNSLWAESDLLICLSACDSHWMTLHTITNWGNTAFWEVTPCDGHITGLNGINNNNNVDNSFLGMSIFAPQIRKAAVTLALFFLTFVRVCTWWVTVLISSSVPVCFFIRASCCGLKSEDCNNTAKYESLLENSIDLWLEPVCIGWRINTWSAHVSPCESTYVWRRTHPWDATWAIQSICLSHKRLRLSSSVTQPLLLYIITLSNET